MKDTNYITIQGWMVNQLKLKGAELITYAVIYGFSQDDQSVFSGTLGYLAEWVGVTKQAVCNILKKLVEKDLIIKIEKVVNGITFYDYKVNQKTLIPIKESLIPIKETLMTPIKESLMVSNNINNNYNNNIYNNIQKPKSKKKEFIPPTLDEWIEYAKSRKLDINKLKRAYESYTVADWHDSRGNKILNW